MYSRHQETSGNLLGVGLLAFVAGAVAWALMGNKATDEVNRNPDFRSLKKRVAKKASEISDLTREKYDAIVDEVSGDYAKLKGISENELVDLVDDLKMHWSRMKDAWNE